jgi:hypothetical protein
MAVMQQPEPLISKAKTDAFTAFALSWLVWLLAAILKLGAPRKSRTLRRWVETLERFVEHTIFLMAAQRFRPRIRQRRLPLNAPHGFQRAYVKRRRRLFFKHARICDRRRSLRQRVLRLISALASPEPYIARFLARLRRRLRAFTIVAATPPAHRCASIATPEVAFSDSS